MHATQHRAKPLPPADRRRAIIEAIIPLLLERGSSLTSREMAEAAGVSEGTIFSVFPDKASVIIEAVKATIDPAPVQEGIAAIDPGDPLETQLEAVADLLLDRSTRVGTLVGVLRTMQLPDSGKPAGAHRFVNDANTAIRGSLTGLLERHRDRLRVEPERAAIVFLGFVSASAHPLMSPDLRPDAVETVDILLHGIAAEPERSR
jgi:AcrR family transcriptional regulator